MEGHTRIFYLHFLLSHTNAHLIKWEKRETVKLGQKGRKKIYKLTKEGESVEKREWEDEKEERWRSEMDRRVRNKERINYRRR